MRYQIIQRQPNHKHANIQINKQTNKQTVARIAQSFYPEILRVCFIVKTPLVFFAIWKIVSLFFDKATLDRVKIFRTSDLSWQAQLQDLTGYSLHDLGIPLARPTEQ
jgi:hypothetical protein